MASPCDVCLQGNLNEEMEKRITAPSGRRGRRPGVGASHPPAGPLVDHFNPLAMPGSAVPAGMMGYHGGMGLPFGTLPGFGLPPAAGGAPQLYPPAGYGLVPGGVENGGAGAPGGGEETEGASAPHPSFPFMYNPLLFNQIYAQNMAAAAAAAAGAANFTGATEATSLPQGETVAPPGDSAARPPPPLAEDLSVRSVAPSSEGSGVAAADSDDDDDEAAVRDDTIESGGETRNDDESECGDSDDDDDDDDDDDT